MKRLILVGLALSLGGCQGLGNTGLTPPASQGPAASSSERAYGTFGGLKFGPLSNAGASLISTPVSSNATDASRTTVAPVSSNDAGSSSIPGSVGDIQVSTSSLAVGEPSPNGGGTSSSMIVPTYWGSYTYGPYGQMKLESVTEAKAPAARGTLAEVVAQLVKPVLADWAPGARLVTVNGILDANGAATSWQLAYVAENLHEAMWFDLRPGGSSVVFLRWSPVVLDVGRLKIDSTGAVQAVVAAIENPNFKSREELLGRDFFQDAYAPPIGVLPGSNSGGAVAMPAVAPDSWSPPPSPRPSAAVADPQASPKVEASATPTPVPTPLLVPVTSQVTLTHLTPGGTWNAQLTMIGDYLVWQLNYQASYLSEVARSTKYPPDEGDSTTYTSSWVSAMVDAATGEVIRFNRPYQYTMTWVKSDSAIANR